VADDFTERYGNLINGSYDCVDRVVLNAFFSIGHNPGGFRCWWRRLHGGTDDQLDDTHLMRMAGRFARRVKAWAAANGVPILSERGLEPAVEALARRSPVPVDLTVRVASRLPGRVELGAYYIVSEALANVAKHANAEMVMVSVEAGRGVLSLSVRDDGVGGADPDGSGLTGLRERAEALGGTLKLTSPPGRGTSVDVRLPAAAR
jgi:signal transduction histidine kinase